MITIAVLQLLTACTFVVIPMIALRHGGRAQHAADREVAAQGQPRDLLARSGITFSETVTAAMLPWGIAVILIALAGLNLAGIHAGRTLTWIIAPLLLVAGGFTTAGQVFPVAYARAALRRYGPQAAGLDDRAMIEAAAAEFPPILRPLVLIRFALVTAGSAAELALLAS